MLPDRYADAERIATGGMGEVYRARDTELGRDVAVKVLSGHFAVDDALRQRFKREALAAARLSGEPNIVTIFDVGEHDSRPFIVMEYLRGGSLADRADARAPSQPGQVLDWLAEAAGALDAAHAAGVIHRDVKPANLLLDDRGHVYVADFGIASAAGLDSFTKTGTVLGTAGYLAPEQARGERASPATDRYALAVVAFELLTGRRPFEADAPTAEAAAHIHAPVPSVHQANPALPPQLDRVFARALAKEPRARYPSAAEFVADLRDALHEAEGATALIAAAPTRPATAPTRRVATQERRVATSGRRWWIPVLLAALLAGGAVAAILVARDGDETAATTREQPRTATFVKTVTQPGTTRERTVTAQPPPPATTQPEPEPTTAEEPPTTTSAEPPTGRSGADLNDAGFASMQAGDYESALPLLEEAVTKLQGTGSLTEAYADYNLAYTRFSLGRCDGVEDLLKNSERIQGHREEIKDLREQAKKTCR